MFGSTNKTRISITNRQENKKKSRNQEKHCQRFRSCPVRVKDYIIEKCVCQLNKTHMFSDLQLLRSISPLVRVHIHPPFLLLLYPIAAVGDLSFWLKTRSEEEVIIIIIKRLTRRSSSWDIGSLLLLLLAMLSVERDDDLISWKVNSTYKNYCKVMIHALYLV